MMMKLSFARVDKISDICLDVAQVSFGTMVIPFFVGGAGLDVVLLGGVVSVLFWILGILVIKK